MNNNHDDIIESISKIQKTSATSTILITLALALFGGSIYYSITRLSPLETEINKKRTEIAELEAKRAVLESRITEIAPIAAAAEESAKPVSSSPEIQTGWIYLGRESSSGKWAPQSDRIKYDDSPPNIKNGTKFTTAANVALVDDIDTETNPSSENGTSPGTKSRQFIIPSVNLTATDIRKLPSVGDGKLIWVRVSISTKFISQISP